MKQINPRIGIVTHFEYDEELIRGIIARPRLIGTESSSLEHLDGVVVSVTKAYAISNCRAASPEALKSKARYQ